MAKVIRNLSTTAVVDPSSISVLEYNQSAGSQKVSEVGRRLIPLYNNGAWTTNATTATTTIAGKNLAVYNNSSSLATMTLGEDATITVLAAGVTDASGHVGIPCMPNTWTYIACGINTSFIASAATLLVFVIDDQTTIKQESY